MIILEQIGSNSGVIALNFGPKWAKFKTVWPKNSKN